MRRRLDGGDVLVACEEGDLLGGRDVQHMDAGARRSRRSRTSRSVQRSAAISSRQTGCEDGSPSTRSPSRSRRRNSSSEWKAARRRVLLQDRRDALVVLDQQVAGRGAHEHLDAGRARQPFQLADIARHSRACRRPRRRSRNACGRCARRTLSASAAALVVSGLVFGISKTAVTPPSTAAREPVSRSSLCSSARLAEMHLAVDHAGQDVQAAAVDRLAGRRLAEIADRGDASVRDADVAQAVAVMVDDGAACQDEVVGRRHAVASGSCRGSARRLT